MRRSSRDGLYIWGRTLALCPALNFCPPGSHDRVMVRPSGAASELAEIVGILFAEVSFRDDEIVRARLAHPDYLPLIFSDDASYIAGQVLAVDGGLAMR